MTRFPSPELVPGVTAGPGFRHTVSPQQGWRRGPVATAPLNVPGPSDAELIDSVRGGNTEAYGSLYERHVGAAYNLARQLTRSTAEADDLVAEAFAKVLDTLRDGRGPDSAFRAYLLTALRHTAYDKTRRDRKLELAEDVTTVASPEAISVQFKDTAVSGLERSLAAKAFARLPERWQAVLWHTEIEGMSPADVAPLLGLTANGVSALAYRAREGLRQAYLQVHLAESTADRCRATVDRLGAWTRGGLSKRETAQVETHLDECERCRALAAELADVNGALRAVIAPLVLGVGAAGYLATIGASTAKAATVLAAGAGAAGAGGAAGAASSVPRQMIGVGASAAALVAVVVLALTSGQSTPITANASSPPVSPDCDDRAGLADSAAAASAAVVDHVAAAVFDNAQQSVVAASGRSAADHDDSRTEGGPRSVRPRAADQPRARRAVRRAAGHRDQQRQRPVRPGHGDAEPAARRHRRARRPAVVRGQGPARRRRQAIHQLHRRHRHHQLRHGRRAGAGRDRDLPVPAQRRARRHRRPDHRLDHGRHRHGHPAHRRGRAGPSARRPGPHGAGVAPRLLVAAGGRVRDQPEHARRRRHRDRERAEGRLAVHARSVQAGRRADQLPVRPGAGADHAVQRVGVPLAPPRRRPGDRRVAGQRAQGDQRAAELRPRWRAAAGAAAARRPGDADDVHDAADDPVDDHQVADDHQAAHTDDQAVAAAVSDHRAAAPDDDHHAAAGDDEPVIQHAAASAQRSRAVSAAARPTVAVLLTDGSDSTPTACPNGLNRALRVTG
ncbi:sigma-70 factor [Kutzneria sp. 744]|nr:sigma-70 factor [Kutzneria sp. 744]